MSEKEFEKLSVTTDTAICKMIDGELCVLLIKRNRKPAIGHWGLLGGFVSVCPRDANNRYQLGDDGKPVIKEETLEQTVRRVMKRDIGVSGKIKINFLKPYDKPNRDNRMRIISQFHYALIPEDRELKINLGNTASDYMWCPLSKLPSRDKMAFDHRDMLDDLKAHLVNTIKHYPIAFELVRREFIMPELIAVFDSILGKRIENIARKVKRLYLLEETGDMVQGRGKASPVLKYKGIKGGI